MVRGYIIEYLKIYIMKFSQIDFDCDNSNFFSGILVDLGLFLTHFDGFWGIQIVFFFF